MSRETKVKNYDAEQEDDPVQSTFKISSSTTNAFSLHFVVQPTTIASDYTKPVMRSFRGSSGEPPTSASYSFSSSTVKRSSSSGTTTVPVCEWKLTLTDGRPEPGSMLQLDLRLTWEDWIKPVVPTTTTGLNSVGARKSSRQRQQEQQHQYHRSLLSSALFLYKSSSITARETKFMLINNKIDHQAGSPVTLLAQLNPAYMLDNDGRYAFTVTFSTEVLQQDSVMNSLGSIFPTFSALYHEGLEAVFHDRRATDVAFLWQNDMSGNEGKITRLFAHQAILRQYAYFRDLLPIPVLDSQGRPQSAELPRRHRWIYTRTIQLPFHPSTRAVSTPTSLSGNNAGVTLHKAEIRQRIAEAVRNDKAKLPESLCCAHSGDPFAIGSLHNSGWHVEVKAGGVPNKKNQSKKKSKNRTKAVGTEPVVNKSGTVTWLDVYLIADKFRLSELRL
ncbi:hypothetical protein BGZ83_008800 [Gryganskiella cystojenkinii]|nr:hypothetical protein BGZ83_008800 [Gryganskiella cystojenkinii]